MNYYEPSKKIIVSSLLFLVLSFVVLISFCCFLLSKLMLVGQGLYDTRNSSESLEQFFAVKSEINDMKEDVALVESFFLSSGGEIEFMEKIEERALIHKVDVEVNNVTIDPKSQVNFADLLRVDVSCEGGLSAVSSFVRALEEMPYLVSVENVQISSNGEKWLSKIALSVYRNKN